MGCLRQKVKGLVFMETENLIGFENNQVVYEFLVIIFVNCFGLEVFWQSIDGFLRLWKEEQKPINFLFLLLNLTFLKNRQGKCSSYF
jgi:hypothetical protein